MMLQTQQQIFAQANRSLKTGQFFKVNMVAKIDIGALEA